MDFKKTLVLTEFYTASGYLERLLFAFSDLEKLHYLPRGKNQIQKLLHDMNLFFANKFQQLESTLIADDNTLNVNDLESHNLTLFRNTIKNSNSFIETMIKLDVKNSAFDQIPMDYINLIYRNCYELHNLIIETSSLDIQYPRSGYISEENILTISQEVQNSRAPLFHLNELDIHQHALDSKNQKTTTLNFLQEKREEKYDQFLHKGHLFITQKNYEEAKVHFLKARNYSETAEILTLLAWTFSLLEDKKEAKSYCLKAIALDSQYGPAYNDYGNYILSEGMVKESLRWFEIAKRAHNYQNREYPYINAGRAYVLLKDYKLALNEFSLALTIAPHHEELHDTVAKLKISLEKEMSVNNLSSTHTNTNSGYESFENN